MSVCVCLCTLSPDYRRGEKTAQKSDAFPFTHMHTCKKTVSPFAVPGHKSTGFNEEQESQILNIVFNLI